MVSIDGTDISSATIDGTDVSEITVDGDVVWTAVPDSGVSRWEFEEGSGSTATDSWNSYDGTLNGVNYTTDSKVGTYALRNDGSGDGVRVPDNSIFDIGNGEALSASIWIKPNNGADQAIAINKGDSSGGVNNVWDIIGNDSGGNYRFSYQDGSTELGVVTADLIGSWHHLVGVYEQGVGVTGYVDGSKVGSDTGNISGWSSSRDLIIGGGSNNTNSDFDGEFDDARIYNKALSSNEVSNLYNNGSI